MAKHALGALVRPIDSFREPKLHECGMVIGEIPTTNSGVHCIVVHPDGSTSLFAQSSLEEFPPKDAEKLKLEILKGLGTRIEALQERYDTVEKLTRKRRSNEGHERCSNKRRS